MEINILERRNDFLKFEIKGSGHTLMNLLRKKLAENTKIAMVMYSVPHPLLEGLVLEIEGEKGVNVDSELTKAISALKGDVKEFRAAWKKAK